MVTKYQKISLFIMRISLGWMFFYAGIIKLIDPDWTAAGYLKSAKTFANLYNLMLTPEILPIINFVNKWGLVLIGISLLVGLLVKISSMFGILMLLLYYIPILEFPKVGSHSFIVDEHVIYSVALIILIVFNAGIYWGLDEKISILTRLRKNLSTEKININPQDSRL